MTGRRPVPVSSTRVPPDPSIAAALGRHHSLSTAVADLVDNSIDAGAHHVLIRVLQRDERAVGLLVIDDGRGMDTDTISSAMAYAHRREYTTADLGHFGIGLKAASLSQADTLYVWSRAWGAPAVGRSLERESVEVEPLVMAYSDQDATARIDSADASFPIETGTVVEWRDVRGFLQSPDPDEQTAWLGSAIEGLRTHLGTVLHRILARGDLTIRIDVLDEAYPEFGSGAKRTVEPLDPFAYPTSGDPGYPQRLAFALPEGLAEATLHLWPPAPGDPAWLLGGRSHLDTQGLYVYRNDRLLQAGGWNGLTSPTRDLIHARAALDISPAVAPHVTINPEKTGVSLDADFVAAWNAGRLDDDGTFADYVATARGGAQDARKRKPRPVEAAEPGRGYGAAVYEAVEENATFFPSSEPVDVRWSRLLDDEVFRVDRDQKTLWLNSRYRAALGGSGLRNDDAQVTKALLHLLLGSHLTGPNAGSREKRIEAAWQAILLAAVQDEERHHTRPPGRHAEPTPAPEDE
jgi:hypothetical protein